MYGLCPSEALINGKGEVNAFNRIGKSHYLDELECFRMLRHQRSSKSLIHLRVADSVRSNIVDEFLEYFFRYFNVILGLIFLLRGWKIYRPFPKEREDEIFRKCQNLYRYDGVFLIIGGLVKVIFN
jgi:hypothetical protein